MKTQHLHIHGRVQGVWFRESMRSEAERMGVTGWVRNAPDGSVEALVQGPDTAVDALIAWARIGPPQARVERMIVTDAQGDYSRFEKRIS
jgi:acylphosphatase